MSTFQFDNVEYEIDALSPEAKLQYDMIVVANKRLSELRLDMAMLQTALNTYATALKPLLEVIPPTSNAGEADTDAATYTSVLQADASSA